MAKNKPKVSVIVCCYNGADALPRALKSLKGQTLKDIEIICVNDGSTDDTDKVMKKFAKGDDRVTVVENAKNVGLASSRNAGIKVAKSDLLMFCDADDYYEPTMCEEMYGAMQKTQADLAVCEIGVVYEAHQERQFDDANYYALKFTGLNRTSDDVVLNTDVSADNKIFKKSILDEYEIRFPDGLRYEDFYFYSAYAAVAQNIYFVNQQLYNYVRHEGSIMADTWSKRVAKDTAIDHLHIGFLLYEFLQKHNLLEKLNERYWRQLLTCNLFALSESKTRERRHQVRVEANAFIQDHQESFDKLPPALRNQITETNAEGLKRITPDKIKRKLIRFFPVYNLQTKNIERLRALKEKTEKLIKEQE